MAVDNQREGKTYFLMALFTCLLHLSVTIHLAQGSFFLSVLFLSPVLRQPVHLRSTWRNQRKINRKTILSPLQHVHKVGSQCSFISSFIHSCTQWEWGIEKFGSLISWKDRTRRNDFSLFTLMSSEKGEILWALYCMCSSYLLKSYSIRWLFACISYLPSEGLDALKSRNVFYISRFVPNRCSVNVVECYG